MAEQQNDVDGESACGDTNSWKGRKCNIALITGITGQVNSLIYFTCHYHCVLDSRQSCVHSYRTRPHRTRRTQTSTSSGRWY